MAVAALMIVLLSALSLNLGKTLTGILTGIPVAATVIPGFVYAKAGRDALLLTLRGFLTGLIGFVIFFQALALLLPELGAWAVLIATLSGMICGYAATHIVAQKAKLPAGAVPA